MSASPKTIRETPVTKVDLGKHSVKSTKEYLAVEEPLDLYVNGELAATIFSTPVMQKEQVMGYLLDEGIAKSTEEIVSLNIREGKARVQLSFDPSSRLAAASVYKVITTACGLWTPEFVRLLDRIDKPSIRSNYRIRVAELFKMLRQFNMKGDLWRQTGGIHSAAIFQDARLVGYGEDVGRHNALDKAIGQAALNGADFERCVVISSGRQPADMVLKAARVGIPIVVSNTSVIYSGVYAALKTGMTLIGFARGSRLNIYTGGERIVLKGRLPIRRR